MARILPFLCSFVHTLLRAVVLICSSWVHRCLSVVLFWMVLLNWSYKWIICEIRSSRWFPIHPWFFKSFNWMAVMSWIDGKDELWFEEESGFSGTRFWFRPRRDHFVCLWRKVQTKSSVSRTVWIWLPSAFLLSWIAGQYLTGFATQGQITRNYMKNSLFQSRIKHEISFFWWQGSHIISYFDLILSGVLEAMCGILSVLWNGMIEESFLIQSFLLSTRTPFEHNDRRRPLFRCDDARISEEMNGWMKIDIHRKMRRNWFTDFQTMRTEMSRRWPARWWSIRALARDAIHIYRSSFESAFSITSIAKSHHGSVSVTFDDQVELKSDDFVGANLLRTVSRKKCEEYYETWLLTLKLCACEDGILIWQNQAIFKRLRQFGVWWKLLSQLCSRRQK